MSKQERFVQCGLRRTIAEGCLRTVSYIPAEFATVGRVLKLKDNCEHWSNGWVVEVVGHSVVDRAAVPDYRKAIRNHRKTTGDQLPRQSRLK